MNKKFVWMNKKFVYQVGNNKKLYYDARATKYQDVQLLIGRWTLQTSCLKYPPSAWIPFLIRELVTLQSTAVVPKVTSSLVTLVRKGIQADGGHFEQLVWVSNGESVTVHLTSHLNKCTMLLFLFWFIYRTLKTHNSWTVANWAHVCVWHFWLRISSGIKSRSSELNSWDTLYVMLSIVSSSTEYFVAEQQCTGNPLLHFHGNNEHFCIVHSNICANNNKKGMYGCLYVATMVNQTYHNVLLLYVHCLSYQSFIWLMIEERNVICCINTVCPKFGKRPRTVQHTYTNKDQYIQPHHHHINL